MFRPFLKIICIDTYNDSLKYTKMDIKMGWPRGYYYADNKEVQVTKTKWEPAYFRGYYSANNLVHESLSPIDRNKWDNDNYLDYYDDHDYDDDGEYGLEWKRCDLVKEFNPSDDDIIYVLGGISPGDLILSFGYPDHVPSSKYIGKTTSFPSEWKEDTPKICWCMETVGYKYPLKVAIYADKTPVIPDEGYEWLVRYNGAKYDSALINVIFSDRYCRGKYTNLDREDL